MEFPWRKYNNKDLIEDFKKLGEKIQNNKIKNNKIKKILFGYKSSNAFFQKERLKTRSQNKQDCVNFWDKNKNKIINYQKKYKEKYYERDLFGIISYFNFCPAQFQPFAAGMIYKYFNCKKVFDPYAGWGDRCVAAMAMNIDYIGCDSNIKLENCYEKMINFFDKYSNSNIEMFFDKTEKIFKAIPKDVDLLFSSPPFFNDKEKLIEEYYNSNDDYSYFMNKSLIPIVRAAFKEKIPVCLYIPENMYKVLSKIFGKATNKFYLPNRPAHDNKMTKSNIIYCWS
jgi:hypothetical protein